MSQSQGIKKAPCHILPPLWIWEEGKPTTLGRKLAFASLSSARASQPAKAGLLATQHILLWLLPLLLSPHPQLTELSCPECTDRSL